MYEIRLERQAAKFLKKIPQKHAKQIVEKIELLAKNPKSIPTKVLRGCSEYSRAKSGEYRIIFRIENNILLINIVLIGKRNDDEVYKEFRKLFGK